MLGSTPVGLVTVEGVDGAGKSTLVAALAAAWPLPGAVAVLREPGGVELGERLRAVVKDPGLTVGARAEALVYAASRAQLVEERVRPLLAAGTWVLLDRFVDSSLAYQGAARGLGVEAVAQLNAFATGGLTPAVTLLVRVEPAVAAARLGARGEAPDRLEAAGAGFQAHVGRAYDELAAREPGRWVVLDGSARPDAVLAAAVAALRARLAP